MKVFVLAKNGKPLMPTSPVKARVLLKQKRAKVIRRRPFTIQLAYETTMYKQHIRLGVDPGYKFMGFSCITEKEELICGELEFENKMSSRIKTRAMYRRTRRGRLWYRPPRWFNRVKSKQKGWLAPSILRRYETHLRMIGFLHKILPVSQITIEAANFDIQKIKNPEISGTEYQEGEQKGFWNTREYILHRDNHKCQNPNCKNKTKNPILVVHHIVYQSNRGSDLPSNLITLCTKCHTPSNHKEGKFLYEWQTSKPKLKGFKDATFMNSVRWRLVNELEKFYSDAKVKHTYGCITKSNRIALKLEKTHYNDAFVITGGSDEVRSEPYYIKQKRKNNRCLQTNRKGYKPATRKQRYALRPQDLVKWNGVIYKVNRTNSCGKNIILFKKDGKTTFNKSPNKLNKDWIYHVKTLVWKEHKTSINS